MLSCVKSSRQQFKKRKISFHCCLNKFGITLYKPKPYAILSKGLQATMNNKKTGAILSKDSWKNIAQVKTLCNVVREAPGRIAQKKKILFNFDLLLLELYFTSQNSIQCSPGSSRQYWIRNSPVQFRFNTRGRTFHRPKPYAVLSGKLKTTLQWKNPVQYCLNTLKTTLGSSKPYDMFPETLQTILDQKMFWLMLC